MNPVQLLSHPKRTLTDHLAQVDLAAALILSRHPVGPFSALGIDVAEVFRALAGWHDIAKATEYFQDYIKDPTAFARRASKGDPTARPELKRHTPLGSLLALRYWCDAGSGLLRPDAHVAEFDRERVGLLVALAVRGHHTGLPSRGHFKDGMKQPELPQQMARLIAAVEGCHAMLSGAVGPLLATNFDDLQMDALDAVDRAFNQLERLPLEQRLRFRLAVQFCFSCLLEADKALLIHNDAADYIGRPGREIPATTVEDHPPGEAGSRPVDRQRQAALAEVIAAAEATDLDDTRPRTLTLPTGLGKTRCAAAWAFHWRARLEAAGQPRPKILLVLPFLSIIEQTASVYREELLRLASDGSANDETLAVSHSLSVRDFGDVEEPAQAEFALDTWRSDIVLTTFDQFLLALMADRARFQQRFHNLCDALVVIDEVQALPCRLWHPVGHLLTELAGAGRTRLLLMTATQPGLIDSVRCVPLVSSPADYVQPRYRLEWDLTPQRLDEWLDKLSAEIARPKNQTTNKWLVVLNTRKSAQAAFRSFREQELREDAFLLSSDIVPRDRLARIAAIHRSKSCVTVTTQCIEAGVDLDMDRVIRDFGPLDSLVQVAGRCNRHGRPERGTVRIVYLVNPDDKEKPFCKYIYDCTLLGATQEVLEQFGRAGRLDEEQVGQMVEEYFRRLHAYMDTGAQTTRDWANFQHDDLNVSRLLRGDQDQVSFVVDELDPGLRQEIERAMAVADRWQRRRELRRVAPRIALVTISAWKSTKYSPDDIADPLPHNWKALGWSQPAFWFLHEDAYDSELGLCLPPKASSMFF